MRQEIPEQWIQSLVRASGCTYVRLGPHLKIVHGTMGLPQAYSALSDSLPYSF